MPDPIVWHGCYRGSWRDVITDEAFAHPAKFARGLICRIFKHGFEKGWWVKGDLIADPFAGIGTGGVVAACSGLRWCGVELESRFIELAQACFERNGLTGDDGMYPTPVMVQGDSRQFSSLLSECSAVVTSPPWQDAGANLGGVGDTPGQRQQIHDSHQRPDAYGHTPGQIGRLKAGDVDGVVTSPPFERQQTGGGIAAALQGKSDYPTNVSRSTGSRNQGYQAQGDTDGQLGNTSGETYWQAMAVVYAETLKTLKPGGVACIVVKDFVKAGKRVPLCDQTHDLLLSLGFKPVERIRAMVVEEERHAGLWEEVVEKKERKSFFRRLAESKGAPPIDWEEVLAVRAAND